MDNTIPQNRVAVSNLIFKWPIRLLFGLDSCRSRSIEDRGACRRASRGPLLSSPFGNDRGCSRFRRGCCMALIIRCSEYHEEDKVHCRFRETHLVKVARRQKRLDERYYFPHLSRETFINEICFRAVNGDLHSVPRLNVHKRSRIKPLCVVETSFI